MADQTQTAPGVDPQMMQKFIAMLKAQGGPGASAAPQAPQQQTPGRVGQTPNVTQTPNIVWDPKTAIGLPPPPSGQQQTGAPRYEQDSGMAQAMMAHLDPKGAAVYSAIQGIGSFLGQVNEKKQKNLASEASNIMQNLMQAIDSKDISHMTAIMTDPKKMKIIEKVYKGWIERAEEASQPQEQKPQSPEEQGGNAGIQQHVDKKMQAQQKQQQQYQSELARVQKMLASGQAPTSIGGYRIPQAGPQEQMQSMTGSAQLQYGKQDPKSMIEGPMTPRRVAEQQMYEAKIAEAREGVIKAQEETKKSEVEVQGKYAELDTKRQEMQNLIATGKIKAEEGQKRLEALDIQKMELSVKKDIAYFNRDAAMFRAQGALARANTTKQKQVPSALMLKYNSAQKALDLLQSIQGGNQGFTKSDVTTLMQELHDSGADELKKMIPQSMWGRWISGDNDTADAMNALTQHISGMKKTFDTQYPGWNKDESGKPNPARDPLSPKPQAQNQDDSQAPQGDETVIDLTEK